MTKPAEGHQHWMTSRKIAERIVIEGDLELLSPAHFGSGTGGGATDMALIRDAYDGSALVPGASIAGALRNYWRERTRGYGAVAQNTDLFGARRGLQEDMDGSQSLLIVDDAVGAPPSVEIRDGVKIDPSTRTAEENKLFDMEMLRVGTRFKLRFELLAPAGQSDALREQLALALQGFERGEILLGARKRRGFGRCQVKTWRVWRYNLANTQDMLAWLARDRGWADMPAVAESGGDAIAGKLDVTMADVDQRAYVDLKAMFALEGSLLVRSGAADQGPDAVHLRRLQASDVEGDVWSGEPILPGTSLAGVLRGRALRIAKTLAQNQDNAQKLIDALFGVGPEDVQEKNLSKASRLIVHETTIDNVRSLVQSRIRIDRFTGGAMDNYLFDEAPVFGGEESRLTVELWMRDPHDYEIGLLLLLLKDLWTGDLPVGGESSVGRGRLKGRCATLLHRAASASHENDFSEHQWKIEAQGDQLAVTMEGQPSDRARETLEGYVKALNQHLNPEVQDGA